MAYKRRYERQEKQNAYENACDCRYYGMARRDCCFCGLSKEESDEVWRLSFWDMAEPEREHAIEVGPDVYDIQGDFEYWKNPLGK